MKKLLSISAASAATSVVAAIATVAAALSLASCMQSRLNIDNRAVGNAGPAEITFTESTGKITRAGELSGTRFNNVTTGAPDDMWVPYCMYVSAAQYSLDGELENPDYFHNAIFRVPNQGENSWVSYSSETAAKKTPLFYPMGGASLDFLAFALPVGDRARLEDPDEGCAEIQWFSDYGGGPAAGFQIYDWDTYATQCDLLYGSRNGFNYTSADNYNWDSGMYNGELCKINFKHAQALLIFNLRYQVNQHEPIIHDVSFVTQDYVSQRRAEMLGGLEPDETTDPTQEQITLKTWGEFRVDNRGADLIAYWPEEELRSREGNWRMPLNEAQMSPCNAVTGDNVLDCVFQYGENIELCILGQLGETLLIPEQDKVAFTICYSDGKGNTMQYTYNDQKGKWLAGKKYIYNIIVHPDEVQIKEVVEEYDPLISDKDVHNYFQ